MFGRNRLFVTGMTVALVLAALLQVGCAGAADTTPIKFAFVAPLTTANALIGASMKTGAELAVADLNAAGGIKGRKVELLMEDNADTNEVAVNALNKALAEKPAALVFGSTSSQTMAMSPIVQKEKVPTLILGSSPSITNAGNPYFFAPRVTDEFAAIAAVRFTTQVLKKQKVAIFYAAEEFGTAVLPIIVKELKNQGLTAVDAEAGPSADKDYTPQLLKIKNSGADVLLAWVLPAPGLLLEQQMKQLQITIPVVANPVFSLSSVLKLAQPGQLAGTYALTDALPDQSTDPKVQAWTKKYMDKYKDPPDLFAALSYDSVMMLSQIITQVGTDSEAVRKGLASLKDYKGVGNSYTADEKGRLAKQMVIVDVSDAKLKFVQVVGAE